MRSKLFVGTLLAAVVVTAGVAEAQSPTATYGNLKNNGVRVFNVTAGSTTILSIQTLFKQGNTDGDIIVFDATDGGPANHDPAVTDGAIGIFNSTVPAYEEGTISVVAGTTVVVCLVHESGPGSKFTMISSARTGSGIANGGVGRASTFEIRAAGEFDLYGSVQPEMAGIQASLQRIVEAKRR